MTPLAVLAQLSPLDPVAIAKLDAMGMLALGCVSLLAALGYVYREWKQERTGRITDHVEFAACLKTVNVETIAQLRVVVEAITANTAALNAQREALGIAATLQKLEENLARSADNVREQQKGNR